MKSLFRSLLLASGFVLLMSCTGWAQRLVAANDRPIEKSKVNALPRKGNPSPEANEARVGALTERRAALNNLQKRREALRRYLLTVNPDSKDYQATESAIRGIDAKLKSLSGEMAKYSPTAEPAFVGSLVAAPSRVAEPSRPPAAAAQQFNSFSDYINSRIREILKANTDQKSNANQTEIPAVSDNSTSLVDQSSGPDLINLAINLAGASTGLTDSKDITPATVTASLYSLAAAFKGADPLNPYFYNTNRSLRRLWFTLGYEKGEKDQSGSEGESATLAGVKFLIIHRRDASYHPNEVEDLFLALQNAAWDVGRIATQVNLELFNDKRVRDKVVAARYKTFLETRIAVVRERIAAGTGNPAANAAALQSYEDDLRILNTLAAGKLPPSFFSGDPNAKNPNTGRSLWSNAQLEFFNEFRNSLWKDALDIVGPAILDDKIEKNIASFLKLTSASQEAFEKIRRAPQLSLAAQAKRRKNGVDEYEGKLIFDYGVMNRVDLTLNGTFNYKDSRLIGADQRGGSFSGQFRFQVNPEGNLIDPNMLLNLYLGGEGKWLTGMKPSYKVQGKVKLTLWDGFDLPFSVTYSNRTELIQESDVRGQFGFSFDTSKLLRLFKFRGLQLPIGQAPGATPNP